MKSPKVEMPILQVMANWQETNKFVVSFMFFSLKGIPGTLWVGSEEGLEPKVSHLHPASCRVETSGGGKRRSGGEL